MKKINEVIKYLKNSDRFSLSDVIKNTGVSSSYIRRFFSFLCKKNMIKRLSKDGMIGRYVLVNRGAWIGFSKDRIDIDMNYKEKQRNDGLYAKTKLYELMGGVCCRCGFSDHRALQIDHINGGGCTELKSLDRKKYIKIVSDSFLSGEKKYQLLCANCNWIKRFENGECLNRKKPTSFLFSLNGIALFIIIFLFSNFLTCYASTPDINLKALSLVESSGNPRATSFLGASYGRGLYQVSEIALKDYLQYHKNEVIHPDDLYNPIICEKVAKWLLFVRIPQVLRHLKRPITLETVLSAYNKGYSKKLANGYITKYRRAYARVRGIGKDNSSASSAKSNESI